MSAPGEKRIRTFVGIALSDDVKRELSESIKALPPWPGRLTPPRNFHVTTLFLGSTTEAQRRAVLDGLARARLAPPFNLVTGSLGAFPDARHARVGWIGFRSGERNLGSLFETMSWLGETIGVEPEGKPYVPHITLARMDTPHDVHAIVTTPKPKAVVIAVDSLALFKSVTHQTGSEYEVLATVPLPR